VLERLGIMQNGRLVHTPRLRLCVDGLKAEGEVTIGINHIHNFKG
jgi:hypothetical protein